MALSAVPVSTSMPNLNQVSRVDGGGGKVRVARYRCPASTK